MIIRKDCRVGVWALLAIAFRNESSSINHKAFYSSILLAIITGTHILIKLSAISEGGGTTNSRTEEITVE